jgi:predicted kinase
VLRSDVERKRLFDVPETERLLAEAYRPEVTEKMYRFLAQKAARVVAAGHSAIVDAVFARASERGMVTAAARDANIEFHALFLVADVETRIARIGARRPDASDADAAIARQQESYDLGRLSWTAIDASGSLDETIERARMAIG